MPHQPSSSSVPAPPSSSQNGVGDGARRKKRDPQPEESGTSSSSPGPSSPTTLVRSCCRGRGERSRLGQHYLVTPKITWTQHATRTHLHHEFRSDKVRLSRNFVDAHKCIYVTSVHFAVSFCSGVYWSLLVLVYVTCRMLCPRHPIKQMTLPSYDRLKLRLLLPECRLKNWWVLCWQLLFLWNGKSCSKYNLSAATDVSDEWRMFDTWQGLTVIDGTRWIS
jgi:hypothetical protein